MSPVMMPVNLLANLRTKKLTWLEENTPVYLNVGKYSIFKWFINLLGHTYYNLLLSLWNSRTLKCSISDLWVDKSFNLWVFSFLKWHEQNVLRKLNVIAYIEYFTQSCVKYSIIISNYYLSEKHFLKMWNQLS